MTYMKVMRIRVSLLSSVNYPIGTNAESATKEAVDHDEKIWVPASQNFEFVIAEVSIV